MSLVISAGNSENLFLGGDGRLSDNDANGNFVILDEDVQKSTYFIKVCSGWFCWSFERLQGSYE